LTAETAVPGSVVPAALANVLDLSELTTVRTQSEVNAGDRINFGAADLTDTLHVFGAADLSLVNGGAALNVGTLVVHSEVKLSIAQLQQAGGLTINFSGNASHTLVITDNNGETLTQAQQEAAIFANAGNLTLVNSGKGQVNVGSGTGPSLADINVPVQYKVTVATDTADEQQALATAVTAAAATETAKLAAAASAATASTAAASTESAKVAAQSTYTAAEVAASAAQSALDSASAADSAADVAAASTETARLAASTADSNADDAAASTQTVLDSATSAYEVASTAAPRLRLLWLLLPRTLLPPVQPLPRPKPLRLRHLQPLW